MAAETEVASMLVGQTIKYSFEGAEVLLKLAGKGAKELAILLAALLKDEKKWAGATSLKRMMREGRPMRVIQIPQDRFKEFAIAAKQHGILFNALQQKNKQNGICDIFIKADDAALVNRVLEHTQISCVEIASIDPMVTYKGKEINPTTPEAGDRFAPASGRSTSISTGARIDPAAATVERPSLSAEELRQAMEKPTYLFEDATRYKSYLEMKGRLYSYSPKNLELIAGQRPDAQMVASRSRWQEMGRTVNGDAEPIIITVPGEVVNGVQTFTDGKVYDISDTDGAPVPLPAVPEEGSEALGDLLLKMRSACPVEVRVDPQAQEWSYSPQLNAVVLPEGLSDTDTFHALACETVHAHMHHILGNRYTRYGVDLMASSAACTVAAHVNLSTDRYIFANVPSLLGQGQSEKALNDMLRASTQLADALNKHLDGNGAGKVALPRITVNLKPQELVVRQNPTAPTEMQTGHQANVPIEYPPSVSTTLAGLQADAEKGKGHVLSQETPHRKSFMDVLTERNQQAITEVAIRELINTGEPLSINPTEGSEILRELNMTLAESIPSTLADIRFSPTVPKAIYSPEDRAIELPVGITDTDLFFALATEGYHANMHFFGGNDYRREEFEHLAQFHAQVIAAHCNIPADRTQFDVTKYLQGRDKDSAMAMLEGAAGSAESITRKIDFHIQNHLKNMPIKGIERSILNER